MNEIKQAQSTNAKYRARWRPDCPGATGDPKRSLQAEGYVRMANEWTQSNYPGGSQGRHGDSPKATSGDPYDV
jgi:hypothetical protein